MLSVLIVDNDPEFLYPTRDRLRTLGWDAEGVETGQQAIDILEASPRKYDAVVIDRSMPGLSGDEIIRRLRGKKDLFDVCIIMATGHKGTESAIAALKLGAFEYLLKPSFYTETLDSILRAGVAWHRAHKMRHDLVRSLDRSKIVESVRNVLKETLRSGDVQLQLFDEGSPEETNEFIEKFQKSDEIVLQPGKSAQLSVRKLNPTVGSTIAVSIRGTGNQLRGILSIQSENELARSWVDVLRYFGDLVGLALELGNDFDKLRDMYREWRHKIATNVQIVAMQARRLQSIQLSSPEESPTSLQERVRFIADNAAVLEAFAQDIKAFAVEPGEPRREAVNLSEIAQSAVREYEPVLRQAGITSKVELDSVSGTIETDQEWLAYSLRCMIRNAVESILDARQERITESPDYIEVDLSGSESHVEIKVRDSGIGFDEDTRRQIFKPLFSTKTRTLPELKGEDSTGSGRVERILALMSCWVEQNAKSQCIPSHLGHGFELFIREGEAIEMFVGHREHGGLNSTRPKETAYCRIGLDSPLTPEWRGRGEGLYTVQKYISRLGGYISASSPGLGQGAEFRIALPKRG